MSRASSHLGAPVSVDEMASRAGMTVSEAARDVGYVSPSRFSREFKRMYGQSPRQWSAVRQLPPGVA